MKCGLFRDILQKDIRCVRIVEFDQAWHLAGYESTLKDARMSTLDEGLMATLTQEEGDAMKDDDVTTQSVDASD
jgi:hypothetical protein